MYWRGHVGIGLCAYAPVAGVVLDAGEPMLAALGGALTITFATLPDADEYLPLPHRGPTHTLAFAIAVGVLLAVGTAVALSGAAVSGVGSGAQVPAWTPVFVGGVVTLTLLSHIVGDVLTPMGIQPFRPFSDVHFTLDVTPAKNRAANYLFLTAGILAVTAAVVRVA